MSHKTERYGGASLRRLRAIAPSHDRGDAMFNPVRQPLPGVKPPLHKQIMEIPCKSPEAANGTDNTNKDEN